MGEHRPPALVEQFTVLEGAFFVRSDSPFTKRSGDMVYTSVLD